MPKMIGRMAPPKAAKPVTAKAAVKMPDMSTAAVLARAERMQRAEAGESRLAKAMPANKPATPTMSAAATAATKAALARAERVQREEASESRMVRRNPNVISTTTNYRATPAKKGK